VPAHENQRGYSYRAPLTRFAIPSEISHAVTAVFGLDNRPAFHPNVKKSPSGLQAAPDASKSPNTGNSLGSLTVIDFAANYDVDPLYSAGITGSGRTIGILTLAAFTPSDAYAYWSALGLSVLPNRITVVNIDGGPGAPNPDSIETTLDVEQAGGIAPGAKIIVYQAPNTNQGFVDVFAAAIEDNKSDSLSTSWGSWEWFNNLDNAPVNDPLHGGIVATTQAIHELLLRASIQGQTAFAASGDGGAYDVNNNLPCVIPYSPTVPFSCSQTLSVDYPASDSLITAGGGTTLPSSQAYCLNSACTPPFAQVQIPQESVWGWDYLNSLCTRLGAPTPVDCGTFPAGSGGGVSVLFPTPSYQAGVAGTQLSQPGQAFYLQPYGLLFALPSNFAGRNVPDVSFNADPNTGYAIVFTSDATGPHVLNFWGGTSFVAPQLNGVTALLDQYVGKRVGFLNPTLYGLAAGGAGYQGKSAPLNNVAFGDNWFYSGTKGYNLGSGLGTLDVFNFAQYLRNQF
jgi:subtilase family serine protease